MDSDFIEKIQNITLTKEEGEVIKVGGTHISKILEECSLSLLGRFLTTCSYNQYAAKSLLRSVWKMGSNLRIVDVGDGLFQFKFALESQLKWVLSYGLWSFENHPLVLRRWERVSEEASRDIGSELGNVVETNSKIFTSEKAHFIRVRVEIPLDKPLHRSGVLVNPKGDRVQVGFKYERLVGFCYRCGKIGHEAKECFAPKDQN
nr:hypothetical protein CFP56_46243 [Quercus suber]